MADIHVLDGGVDGKSWKVTMHFDVPDQANAVSVNYRDALVASGLGGTTKLDEGAGLGQITAAEKVLIESGARYEHAKTLPALESGGTTPTELLASARLYYVQEKNDMLNQLAVRLKYYGFTADEE